MHAKVYDRTERPVVYRSLGKTSDERLPRIYYIVLFLVLDRSIVYSWRRFTVTDGGCKDNTSEDPFSQCEQLQGIHIQVKSEYVGTLTDDDWINDTKQSDKHNNMFNVAANLKHVHTHENNNWRLVNSFCLLVCSVSS